MQRSFASGLNPTKPYGPGDEAYDQGLKGLDNLYQLNLDPSAPKKADTVDVTDKFDAPYSFDEKGIRVTVSRILLEPGEDIEVHPALIHSQPGDPPKTVILHVILWTADSNGSHYYYDAHSFEGVVENNKKETYIRFQQDQIEFKFQNRAYERSNITEPRRVDDSQPGGSDVSMWGLTVRVACETPHSNKRTTKAFQVVGNVGVLLSVPLQASGDDRLSHFTMNDCFERLWEYTPLEALAETGRLSCHRLKIGCDDNTRDLHPWQHERFEAFLFSCEFKVGPMEQGMLRNWIPTEAQKQYLLNSLYEDNKHITAGQKRGEAGYKALYNECCRRGHAQYEQEYQQSVPGVHFSTQEHYNMFQLDPDHCKVHPRVLMNILCMAADKCGVTREQFEQDCARDPEMVVQGLYKTMLVLAANSVRYEFDMDCRGQPGERFTNTWGMFDLLHKCGRDNSNAASDCEDYAYFMAKLHVAYSNADALLGEFGPMLKGTAALDYQVLTELQEVISPWTVLPITCSTYNASAHGESLAGQQAPAYQTHTCAVIIPKGRLVEMITDKHMKPSDMNKWDESVAAGKPLATVLLEGTALVSNGHDLLLPRSTDPATMHPVDQKAKCFADPLGCDSTFPIALDGSHFYAYVNQMCVDGNTYVLHRRVTAPPSKNYYSHVNTIPAGSQKLQFGVPMCEFLSGCVDPRTHSVSCKDQCCWKPMYNRRPTTREMEAQKRLHIISSPAFRLDMCCNNNLCDCGEWGRPQADIASLLSSDSLAHHIKAVNASSTCNRAHASTYGILRGEVPMNTCNMPPDISIQKVDIANGFNVVFYQAK